MLVSIRSKAGRNNQGRVTVRYRRQAGRRLFKKVDFFRKNYADKVGFACGFCFDSNRNNFLTVVGFLKKKKVVFSFILGSEGIQKGDIICNFFFVNSHFLRGSSYFLGNLPVGSQVSSVEFRAGFGGQLARSAGTSCTILQKNNYVLVKAPSGKFIYLKNNCRAVFGVNGAKFFRTLHLIKAGRAFWLGKKPKVRGVAINPVDHPHGGGEGKGRVGRIPVSPWGWITKGQKL